MENDNNDPGDAIETSRNETQRNTSDRTLEISVPRLNVEQESSRELPVRDTMYSEDNPKYCKHLLWIPIKTYFTCHFTGWVCFATDQDDKEGSGEGFQFITPCKCKGTLKNVNPKVRPRSYQSLILFVVVGASKLSSTMGR